MKKTNNIITLLLCLGLLTGCVNQYSSGGTVGNNPLDEGKEIEEKEEESETYEFQ